MKKTKKISLDLGKEIIAFLSDEKMNGVRGGAPTATCNTGCLPRCNPTYYTIEIKTHDKACEGFDFTENPSVCIVCKLPQTTFCPNEM